MKRTVTILGGDERMAWLAESLRREGYIIRLAALLPPAPLKNRLPQPETPDRLLPESETVILAVPTVGPDGMLRTRRSRSATPWRNACGGCRRGPWY